MLSRGLGDMGPQRGGGAYDGTMLCDRNAGVMGHRRRNRPCLTPWAGLQKSYNDAPLTGSPRFRRAVYTERPENTHSY